MLCSNCGKELDVSVSPVTAHSSFYKTSGRSPNKKIVVKINAPEEEKSEEPRYCLKCARVKINPAGPTKHLGYIVVNKEGIIHKGDI